MLVLGGSGEAGLRMRAVAAAAHCGIITAKHCRRGAACVAAPLEPRQTPKSGQPGLVYVHASCSGFDPPLRQRQSPEISLTGGGSALRPEARSSLA